MIAEGFAPPARPRDASVRHLRGPAIVDHHRAMDSRWAYIAAFALMIVAWVTFFALFAFRRSAAGAPTAKMERVSIVGIVIQGVAFGAVWMLQRRPWFSPVVPLPGALALLPPLLACVLAIASVWLARTAIGTLGREWSLQARLVEGHRLVTAGPYGLVRHPIYTAMLGMLVAQGVTVSHWIGLVGALPLFALGTWIRVHSEEKLLRGQFGAAYEAYARRVPAVVPLRFGG